MTLTPSTTSRPPRRSSIVVRVPPGSGGASMISGLQRGGQPSSLAWNSAQPPQRSTPPGRGRGEADLRAGRRPRAGRSDGVCREMVASSARTGAEGATRASHRLDAVGVGDALQIATCASARPAPARRQPPPIEEAVGGRERPTSAGGAHAGSGGKDHEDGVSGTVSRTKSAPTDRNRREAHDDDDRHDRAAPAGAGSGQ